MNNQELMLELTSNCNLNCKMCAFKSGFTGLKMTRKQIISILKDVIIINEKSRYYHFDSIRLDGNSEPLLYDDLEFVIDEGRKNGINHFYIVSNGVLLTKDASDMLLNSNIDSLDISMTGIIPEIYGNFQGYGLSIERCQAQIDTIISNIQYFIEQKNKNNKKTLVTMRYIVTKENGYHYIEYINFFRKMKVDAIMAMTLTTNILHSKCSPLGDIIGRKSCDSPNHPVVCANGNVLFSNCQYDIPILGNAFKDGFANTMLSEQAEQYILGIRDVKTTNMPENCQHCYNTHIYEGGLF